MQLHEKCKLFSSTSIRYFSSITALAISYHWNNITYSYRRVRSVQLKQNIFLD